MFLNVGGALLGVAFLTVIDNSVVLVHGGDQQASARFAGYKSAYYGAVALCGFGMVLSLLIRETRCYAPGDEGTDFAEKMHGQCQADLTATKAVNEESNEYRSIDEWACRHNQDSTV